MAQIPTAENVIRSQFCEGEFDEIMDYLNNSIEPSIKSAMIEFARLQVEKALEARDRLYQTYFAEEINWTEDNIKFIKDSYPLTNIK